MTLQNSEMQGSGHQRPCRGHWEAGGRGDVTVKEALLERGEGARASLLYKCEESMGPESRQPGHPALRAAGCAMPQSYLSVLEICLYYISTSDQGSSYTYTHLCKDTALPSSFSHMATSHFSPASHPHTLCLFGHSV